MVAGLKKNVGCKAEKIIPKKIKKPEITKTLNISSGGDNERHKEREGGGKKATCFNSICSLGSDKKHSEESNIARMTTVHLNNTIIPCHQG